MARGGSLESRASGGSPVFGNGCAQSKRYALSGTICRAGGWNPTRIAGRICPAGCRRDEPEAVCQGGRAGKKSDFSSATERDRLHPTGKREIAAEAVRRVRERLSAGA